MYLQGEGVPKNSTEAIKWLEKAAEQFDPQALHSLGAIHANGMGVPRDLVPSYMWLLIAWTMGHDAF